jgi:hypothetical protein
MYAKHRDGCVRENQPFLAQTGAISLGYSVGAALRGLCEENWPIFGTKCCDLGALFR